MKKLLVRFVLLALALTICGAAAAETLAGGWEVTPAEAHALPKDAQSAFEKATAQLDGAEYIPVALMSSQVVAGMNYCVLCQVTYVVPDAVPFWALVYIYADPEGNAEITNVYDIDIPRHWAPAE